MSVAWRRVTIRELWGLMVYSPAGTKLGRVVATIRRDDDTTDLLVQEQSSRKRACRLHLDEVEIDDAKRLWVRPVATICVTAVGMPGP